MRTLTLLRTGPLALVVDLGRPGYAHLGVPPSGALDAPALRLANRLVGNPEGAAGCELLLGGAVLRAGVDCTVAVTGPPVRLRVASSTVDSHTPRRLPAGTVLHVSTPDTGLRCYLAVSGGLEVPAELGSRSTDVLSGLGPAPLAGGDVLPLGPPTGPPCPADVVPASAVPGEVEVPVLLGPREEWVADAAASLRAARWKVSPTSNRVGLRLDGPPLRRAPGFEGGELPSEAVVTGAVQVPPDGAPVVFLADHPTTGGYPVVGVVDPAALPALAQARPGSAVRLLPVG